MIQSAAQKRAARCVDLQACAGCFGKPGNRLLLFRHVCDAVLACQVQTVHDVAAPATAAKGTLSESFVKLCRAQPVLAVPAKQVWEPKSVAQHVIESREAPHSGCRGHILQEVFQMRCIHQHAQRSNQQSTNRNRKKWL
jgi:hypothetical protein